MAHVTMTMPLSFSSDNCTLWFDVSGGQAANNTYHLFSVFDCSKLCLRNVSLRQECNHSERHGIYVIGGLNQSSWY